MKKNQEVVADPYSEAMSIALYALAPRAKSRDELYKQLLKRGVDSDNANAVLDSLELQGLLNDLEFAKLWSESRQRAKKLSKRVIAGELRTKGVSQDIILLRVKHIRIRALFCPGHPCHIYVVREWVKKEHVNTNRLKSNNCERPYIIFITSS